MADLSLTWGGDLGVSASGDLALSTGTQAGQERVLRRLLTNAQSGHNPIGDYVWHTGYGAGLGWYVGQPLVQSEIAAVALQQMAMEQAVSQSPAPGVSLTNDNAGVFLNIQYVDANTSDSAILAIPVG